MPIRAVVDTNILVSALLAHGTPRELLHRLQAGQFQLVLSSTLQLEYETVLARPVFAQRFGLTDDEMAAFLRALFRWSDVVELGSTPLVEVRDPNDVHVLATALVGKADYLVTGDADLLSLSGDERITPLRIVTPKVFLTVFDRGTSAPRV